MNHITYNVTANTRSYDAVVEASVHRHVQALGRITGKASEFNKSLEASNARVLAFGASAGAIYSLKRAFDFTVGSMIDVEKSLVDINTLLGLNQSDLAKFGSSLFAVSVKTASSFKDATLAATEFSRQGLSVNETLNRTEVALGITRLSGLELTESISSLTAAMNTFNREGLTAIEFGNKLATVDAKFAVSAGDLAQAIKRVGSTAEDSNVSLNQMLAIVTATQQKTARGGAIIGNSFKTIFTRLQRPQTLIELENLGITTREVSGATLPLMDILGELANKYDSLAPSVKSQTAELLGGVFQVNVLKAALSDLGSGYSSYEAALKVASQRTDEFRRRNEELNQTLSAKLAQTLASSTELFAKLGDITIRPVLTGGLGGIQNILKTANDTLTVERTVDDEGKITEKSQGLGGMVGHTIATGLLGGLGGILAGPGMQIVTSIVMKLAIDFVKFFKDSVKEFIGLNGKAASFETLQKQISLHLQKQPQLLEKMRQGTVSVSDVHDTILKQIREENRLMILRESISARIASHETGYGRSTPSILNIPTYPASMMGTAGLIMNVATGGKRGRFASGFNPEFASEEAKAVALGASSTVKAHISKGTIGGKRFIMNNQEIEIPNAGKTGDSAVFPKYRGFAEGFSPLGGGGMDVITSVLMGVLGNFSGGTDKFIAKLDGSADRVRVFTENVTKAKEVVAEETKKRAEAKKVYESAGVGVKNAAGNFEKAQKTIEAARVAGLKSVDASAAQSLAQNTSATTGIMAPRRAAAKQALDAQIGIRDATVAAIGAKKIKSQSGFDKKIAANEAEALFYSAEALKATMAKGKGTPAQQAKADKDLADATAISAQLQQEHAKLISGKIKSAKTFDRMATKAEKAPALVAAKGNFASVEIGYQLQMNKLAAANLNFKKAESAKVNALATQLTAAEQQKLDATKLAAQVARDAAVQESLRARKAGITAAASLKANERAEHRVQMIMEKQADTRKRLQSAAIKGSIGLSMAAGSGYVQKGVTAVAGASAGEAAQGMTEGLATAAQILSAMPNKIGVAAAGLYLVGKTGFEVAYYLTGNADKLQKLSVELEVITSQVSRSTAAMNDYIRLQSSLESAYSDNKTSTETLSEMQNKAAKALAAMPESVRAKLSTATTPEEKTRVINDYQQDMEKKKTAAETKLTIQKKVSSASRTNLMVDSASLGLVPMARGIAKLAGGFSVLRGPNGERPEVGGRVSLFKSGIKRNESEKKKDADDLTAYVEQSVGSMDKRTTQSAVKQLSKKESRDKPLKDQMDELVALKIIDRNVADNVTGDRLKEMVQQTRNLILLTEAEAIAARAVAHERRADYEAIQRVNAELDLLNKNQKAMMSSMNDGINNFMKGLFNAGDNLTKLAGAKNNLEMGKMKTNTEIAGLRYGAQTMNRISGAQAEAGIATNLANEKQTILRTGSNSAADEIMKSLLANSDTSFRSPNGSQSVSPAALQAKEEMRRLVQGQVTAGVADPAQMKANIEAQIGGLKYKEGGIINSEKTKALQLEMRKGMADAGMNTRLAEIRQSIIDQTTNAETNAKIQIDEAKQNVKNQERLIEAQRNARLFGNLPANRDEERAMQRQIESDSMRSNEGDIYATNRLISLVGDTFGDALQEASVAGLKGKAKAGEFERQKRIVGAFEAGGAVKGVAAQFGDARLRTIASDKVNALLKTEDKNLKPSDIINQGINPALVQSNDKLILGLANLEKTIRDRMTTPVNMGPDMVAWAAKEKQIADMVRGFQKQKADLEKELQRVREAKTKEALDKLRGGPAAPGATGGVPVASATTVSGGITVAITGENIGSTAAAEFQASIEKMVKNKIKEAMDVAGGAPVPV